MDASCVPVALLAVQWRLPKALDTPQRTSSRYKGRGKAQARAHPAQSPIAVGQPNPKAFLWVCCIHHGHQRHFQNEVCHLPSLWDGQTLLPFPHLCLTGALATVYQPLGGKAASGKCKALRSRISSRCSAARTYLSLQAAQLCQNKQDVK